MLQVFLFVILIFWNEFEWIISNFNIGLHWINNLTIFVRGKCTNCICTIYVALVFLMVFICALYLYSMCVCVGPHIIFMLRKTDVTGRFIIFLDYGIVFFVVFVVWVRLFIFLIIYAVNTNNIYLMSNTETRKVDKVHFEASV